MLKKYFPFHFKATVNPSLPTHWLMMTFNGFIGLMEADSVQANTHINAITDRLKSTFGDNKIVIITGTTTIWWIPIIAISSINMIRIINSNKMELREDQIMTFSTTSVNGVCTRALPNSPADKNNPISVLDFVDRSLKWISSFFSSFHLFRRSAQRRGTAIQFTLTKKSIR